MAFKYDIAGLSRLRRKLEKAPKELLEVIDGDIKDAVVEINAEQVKKAPVDRGPIRQHTFWKANEKANYSLFSNMPYAAFVEFGTGKKVSVPKGLEDVASAYKGAKGEGTWKEFLKNLTAWVRRKGLAGTYSTGIKKKDGEWVMGKSKGKRRGNKETQEKQDKQVAYVIMKSIFDNGMNPQPFFYGPFLTRKKQLTAKIAKRLKDI